MSSTTFRFFQFAAPARFYALAGALIPWFWAAFAALATLAALGYFVVFLLLSAYEPSALTRPVTGGLSTGLLLGLVQVPVTWLAVVLYECTARRYVDPLAARVRRHAPPDPLPRTPDHDGLVEPGR